MSFSTTIARIVSNLQPLQLELTGPHCQSMLDPTTRFSTNNRRTVPVCAARRIGAVAPTSALAPVPVRLWKLTAAHVRAVPRFTVQATTSFARWLPLVIAWPWLSTHTEGGDRRTDHTHARAHTHTPQQQQASSSKQAASRQAAAMPLPLAPQASRWSWSLRPTRASRASAAARSSGAN